jgi:uncharacterized metal-binding protein YceD (DUF177 family)
MTNESERAAFTRPIRVDEIKDGASAKIETTEAEMEDIARLLDLVALTGLVFGYRFEHGGGGRWRFKGHPRADVTQTCVVSLAPVETQLDLPVEAAFWPASLIDHRAPDDEEPASQEMLDWPEAIVDGKIDLGTLVYETLATALDPYPKRAGASFDWSQGAPDEAGSAKTGPFAVLSALKRS